MQHIYKFKIMLPILILTVVLAISTRTSVAHIMENKVKLEITKADGQVMSGREVYKILEWDFNHTCTFILESNGQQELLTTKLLKTFPSTQQFFCESLKRDLNDPNGPEIYGLLLTPQD